jgi:hypothetical protein
MGTLTFSLSFVISFVLSFVISLVRILSSFWNRPRQRAKGSLQRATFVRTVEGKPGLCVPHYDLSRSNTSNE